MADNSAIEWTDSTWNPIRARNLKTGKIGWHCEHATTGCEFCYSEGFNKRLGTGLAFKPGHRADIEIFLDEEMLTLPLHWKRPRMIFVCSMTDLFADFVPDEFIDRMFAVMALAPEHMFQVLTKRAERMQNYFVGKPQNRIVTTSSGGHPNVSINVKGAYYSKTKVGGSLEWPLPNIWLGVSAEREQEAVERIPRLLETPAAIHFLSAEPLLGGLRLDSFFDIKSKKWINALDGIAENCAVHAKIARLDWVIAGGESGRQARAMHPDWARGLRDQCAAAGTAFFFKQWGEWAPSTPEQAKGNPHSGWRTIQAHPHVARAEELYPENGAAFIERVGKKAAGRLLDGVEHNEFPTRMENLHGV